MKKKKMKTPLFRIVKNDKIKISRTILICIVIFMMMIIAVSGLVLAMHFSPLKVAKTIIWGAFGKEFLIRETIKNAIPLVVISIGLSLAFKMKFWNIGGEGQVLIGGIACTFISFIMDDSVPQGIVLVLMAITSIVVAGIYGIIPALFKAKFNTNETILTLMLNYVAIQIVILLQNSKSWQDPTNSFPKIRMLSFSHRLPMVLGVHIGWILTIAIVILYYIYMNRTKHGFEVKIVGDSENTAKYAGINKTKIMVRTMFLSAALCGIAGYFQVAGADGTLSESTSGGMGFTAIMIAWMSEMNPIGIVAMSILIAVLNRGADNLQTVFLIPSSFADIMIGIMLLFMLVGKFLTKYKVVIIKGGAEK